MAWGGAAPARSKSVFQRQQLDCGREVALFSHWPIRYKLFFCTAILFLVVGVLSCSSCRGVYAYRELVRGISQRASELEPASALTVQVSQLQGAGRAGKSPTDFAGGERSNASLQREQFELSLFGVKNALQKYQTALEQGDLDDPFIGDKRREWETVREVHHCLDLITQIYEEHDWLLEPNVPAPLEEELHQLGELTNQLPRFLQDKMLAFREEARGEYRTYIVLAWVASTFTLLGLAVLVRLLYVWVFHPLRTLINGSRRVASGDFAHRIHLPSGDEVAELAMAMNEMTSRFQQIRDDLDQQVQQRTREVVRSEQLASVGFLAAGVAHEINNPLASIAWSAESLESRLHEILNSDEELDAQQSAELDVLRKYLRRIQDEAFRCKGITEKLLDFSRLGDIQRQDTDLRELVQVVIDMVKHLGKHNRKAIEFHCDQHVVVSVNPQEIKQVVLNLLTNALDSLEQTGKVVVHLERGRQQALLSVTDDGVGMTPEVLTHLFEPFFTRKRGGQGTGLGLSITYRIITDHGGTIQATSDGPGKGSRFLVTFPLSHHEEKEQRQQLAA